MHASIEKLPRQQQHHKLLVTMARHPELCCLIVAVILSVFSRYAKSSPKAYVTQQPLPKRFFGLSSPVVDYPYGNLGDVANLLQEEETIVVMYYAPWCSKSKAARYEYEKAATYLMDQVRLVAINCWFSQGQCRQQNQFYSYPVIFFYHTNLDGHRYQGVLKAEHLISFVTRLLYPLLPIYSEEELALFIAKHDHAVVGFFDFNSSPQPPGFEQFYYASMRVVEKDPVKVVEFGIIMNPDLAKDYMVGNPEHLVFLTNVRNETLKYPSTLNFTSSSLTKWVLALRTQYSVKWFSPLRSKSLMLGTEIKQGPTLIVFTPQYPLTTPNQYHSMLREVALDYFDCKNSTRTKGMIDTSIYLRWEGLVQQMDLAESCRQLEQEKGTVEEPQASVPLNTRSCCMSYIVDGPPTRYNACDVCVTYQPSSPLSAQQCRMLTIGDLPEWTLHTHPNHECKEIRDTYNPDQVWSMCCDRQGHQPLNSLHHQVHSHFRHSRSPPSRPPHSDPFVSDAISNHLIHKCHKLKLRQKNSWVALQHIPSLGLGAHDRTPSLKGLACETNRTLNLIVIDSRENRIFARHLGLNIHGKPPNSTGAVIIDEQNEVHHILPETVTKKSIANFISNFTRGSLDRELRSLKNEERTIESLDESSKHVVINELTSATFKDFIMQEDKDVLVLHYSTWCAFCRNFAHTFLSLIKYFSSSSAVQFARINGDIHDLPWEYTVETYPSLQFFPAHRKTESMAYPEHLPKTLPYLIEFVMTHSTWTVKLETGVSICNRLCIQENIYNAARKVADLRIHLHWLQNRADQMRSLIDTVKQAQRETEQSTNSLDEYPEWVAKKLAKESPHSRLPLQFLFKKVALLEYYGKDLQRRKKLTELRLSNAIKFYQTLHKSRGLFLEQHKLMQLLRRHLLHQTRINLRHPGPEEFDFTNIDDPLPEQEEEETEGEEEEEEGEREEDFSHDEL